jgi:hypothetical protein
VLGEAGYRRTARGIAGAISALPPVDAAAAVLEAVTAGYAGAVARPG